MRIAQLEAMISARLTLLDVDAPPHDPALSLSRPGIGLVVVTGGAGEAAGVLSKSDLVRHLADPSRSATTVSALMSRPFIHFGPDDDVHQVWQAMTRRSLQNAPVLGAGARPLGVLDIRDAMKVLFEQEEMQERLLANYIAGVGYQ